MTSSCKEIKGRWIDLGGRWTLILHVPEHSLGLLAFSKSTLGNTGCCEVLCEGPLDRHSLETREPQACGAVPV